MNNNEYVIKYKISDMRTGFDCDLKDGTAVLYDSQSKANDVVLQLASGAQRLNWAYVDYSIIPIRVLVGEKSPPGDQPFEGVKKTLDVLDKHVGKTTAKSYSDKLVWADSNTLTISKAEDVSEVSKVEVLPLQLVERLVLEHTSTPDPIPDGTLIPVVAAPAIDVREQNRTEMECRHHARMAILKEIIRGGENAKSYAEAYALLRD